MNMSSSRSRRRRWTGAALDGRGAVAEAGGHEGYGSRPEGVQERSSSADDPCHRLLDAIEVRP